MKLSNMIYSDGIGKRTQIRFGGLNHTAGAKEGELWDMENLTSDHAPLIASRRPRYQKMLGAGTSGVFWHGALCYVIGKDFYYDGKIKGQVSEGKKTFCAMGAYVVVFPDKCYYNIKSDTFGSLEASWSGKNLKFTDGTYQGKTTKANTVVCTGVKWSDYFRVGDAVFIEGCKKHAENNISIIIREIDGAELRFYENSFTLEGGKEYTETVTVKISRKVPDLLYLCENENRMWGCTEDEIFCCKQNDIFNWYCNDKIADDSWSTPVGSVGPFTGCFAYKGFPIFFKEDHVYKIYGSIASEFQALGSATLGLAEGCGDSLAVAGETLFYLSRTGIVAYSGGIPQPVSDAFGVQRFTRGVAGSDGLKYYICMTDEDGGRWLYVYDTQKGMWHKDANCDCVSMTRWDGAVAALAADGTLTLLNEPEEVPEGFVQEEAVCWKAEFSDFTEENPNKKRIGKLQIRLELDTGATAQVQLQTDSDGQWRPVGPQLQAAVKRSYYLPIVPRRCDHYRIKLEGSGGCRIYSLVRQSSSGSELRSTFGRN